MWAILSAILLVLLIIAFIFILDQRYRPQPATDVVVVEQDVWPWWYGSGSSVGWGPYWRHGGRGILPYYRGGYGGGHGGYRGGHGGRGGRGGYRGGRGGRGGHH